MTRFLWFRDPEHPDKLEGNIDIYRFCRVSFGIVCSPFLLEGTLKFHLKNENSLVAKKILENLYVDNVTMGSESVNEAYQIFVESRANNSGEITLPRLELLGVLIGVRAANFIVQELKLPIYKRYLWTDSECVLHWMKSSASVNTIVCVPCDVVLFTVS